MFNLKYVLILTWLVLCLISNNSSFAAPSDQAPKQYSKNYEGNYCNCDCGITNKKMRVVGGNVTKMHEFPWMAGISRHGDFHCGAALISRNHLITAAHCVNGFKVQDLTVVLGDHDRQSNNRFSHIVVRGLKSARKHEHFDPATYNNDIAILELDYPVDFDEKVSPVCLPGGNFYNYYGRSGIITGWGRTAERESPSHILKKLTVPIWNKEECYNSGYGERKISENMFCAGYPEGAFDACQGDSGGPLQMGNEQGNMEIVGVVSWGRGCARPHFPGIYTKVGNYLHWIEEILEDECICSTSLFRGN